jgi:hypothetical protein
MKKTPKIDTINWIEDLNGAPENSQLIALARQAKEGKIKIWDTLSTNRHPFVVIIYEETQKPDYGFSLPNEDE